MKKVLKKLSGKAGESLIEVLCAILIFTLASVGMYSMVMAANDINATAKEADRSLQEQMIIVEQADQGGVPGTITITPSKIVGNAGSNTADTITVDVEVYQAEELFSYFKAEEGGTE